MKSFWKIAIPVAGVALICGTTITWRHVKTEKTQRKLADAANLARTRAEQGDTKAQVELARMYLYGKGVPPDYAESVRWFRKAADQGDAKGQYGLCYAYVHGEGVTRDYGEASRWCQRAAEQGDSKAKNGIGNLYYYGLGQPKDYAVAARWYRESAEQEEPSAQSALGYMYYYGQGVPQDYAEAAHWYRKAAEHGDAFAESTLGYMYQNGQGLPRDYTEAAKWYRQASNQGDEYARKALASWTLGFSLAFKFEVCVVSLGSILLAIGSRGRIRTREQCVLALAALSGLSWVGLNIYGHLRFGILRSMSLVTAFYLSKKVLEGISSVLLVSIIWPHSAETLLKTVGVLFIALNAFIVYLFVRFGTVSRVCYWGDAFLAGAAITSAILLWVPSKKIQQL